MVGRKHANKAVRGFFRSEGNVKEGSLSVNPDPSYLDRDRQLYRKPRKGIRRTLAEVGGILFEEGFCSATGKAYAPAQIKRLLGC